MSAGRREAPAWTLLDVARLFRGRRGLLWAFALSSLGRSVASVTVLLLIQRFLSGQLDPGAERSPLFAGLVGLLGERGSLWAAALLLLVVQIAGSLCSYANHVAQQHVNKVVELGTIEVLIGTCSA